MSIDTDLAWAAGFIDGEGSIRIIRRKADCGKHPYRYSLELNASQVDSKPLIKLKKLFGGNIRIHSTSGQINRATCYLWFIGSSDAGEVLKLLLPYLTVKKNEAVIAIRVKDLFMSNPNRHISQQEYAVKESAYNKIKNIKDVKYNRRLLNE